MRKVNVKQTEEEVPAEVIAESLVEISKGVKQLRSGRLNDKALVVLLQHSTGVSQAQIKLVLNGLESLEHQYTRGRR